MAGDGDVQRIFAQSTAGALRAADGFGELQRAVPHALAVRVRQNVHHVTPGAPELALVTVVDAAFFGLDEHLGVLLGEQKPVSVLLLQRAPRRVDVDTHAADDAAQIRALPGARPRRDRSLPNAQRGVGNEQFRCHIVEVAQPTASWAGTGDGIR